ncbi:MAG: DMT family transporter [Porphyromonas sp.]|nr:DMT family transporter [Porphyromonas sp.]
MIKERKDIAPASFGPEQFKGHLAILGANIIFGVNTAVTKMILHPGALDPLTISFLRFSGAMLSFWILSLFLPKERVAGKDYVYIALASLFGVFGNQISFLFGLQQTSPTNAVMIFSLGPVIVLILATIVQKEPLTFRKGFGVFLGALGAIWLALKGGQIDFSSGGDSVGILILFMGSLFYAFYLTLFKRIIMTYSPVTLMKWMFLFATVASMPISGVRLLESDLFGQTPSYYAMLAYLVFGATFVAYLLIPIAQRKIRPTVVSMYGYIQPILTIGIAILLGLDSWQWGKVPSMLMIFLGVYLVTTSKKRIA